jgi:hypothetical protein
MLLNSTSPLDVEKCNSGINTVTFFAITLKIINNIYMIRNIR